MDEKLIQLNFNKKVETNVIKDLGKNGIVIMQYMDKEKDILCKKYTKVHLNLEKMSSKCYSKSERSWLEKATRLLITEDIKEIEGR